jgi:hypothetical protein
MARMAARIATGHCQGVKVMDTEQGRGYILYSDKRNSHRKVEVEDEQDTCPECNNTEIKRRDIHCGGSVIGESKCADCGTEVE